jgi:hypothetical protein
MKGIGFFLKRAYKKGNDQIQTGLFMAVSSMINDMHGHTMNDNAIREASAIFINKLALRDDPRNDPRDISDDLTDTLNHIQNLQKIKEAVSVLIIIDIALGKYDSEEDKQQKLNAAEQLGGPNYEHFWKIYNPQTAKPSLVKQTSFYIAGTLAEISQINIGEK